MMLEPAETRSPGRTVISHSGPKQDVAARAEFDQSDALADGDAVARLPVEDDAAGDQAGDLFEDHAWCRRPSP